MDMRSVVVICALLGAVACGKKIAPGKTPKATAKTLETALRKRDIGGAYDLLTARGRSGLTQRDKLVDWMSQADKKATKPYESLQLVVLKVKKRGTYAAVRVSQIFNGNSRELTIALVKEGNVWKVDSPLLLQDLVARIRPAPPPQRFT